MTRSPLWANRGDIFFTHSQSRLGRLIRWAESDPGETNGVWANHVGVVTGSGWLVPPPADMFGAHLDVIADGHATAATCRKLAVVVEALGRVRCQEWWTAHGNEPGNEIRAFRLVTPITEPQLLVLVTAANGYVGDRYGWWKLLGHLADRAIFRGNKVISRLFWIDRRPICSYLAAHVFAAVDIHFGMDPDAADPDEMQDFCEANPQAWAEVK